VASRSNHVEAATHHPDSSRDIYQAYSHLLWTATRRHAASHLMAHQRPAVIATEVRAELVSACEEIGSRLSPLTESRQSPTTICWCTCTDLPHCHTWSSRRRRQKKSKLIGPPVRMLLLLTSLFLHQENRIGRKSTHKLRPRIMRQLVF
jgi:hypothetical protein